MDARPCALFTPMCQTVRSGMDHQSSVERPRRTGHGLIDPRKRVHQLWCCGRWRGERSFSVAETQPHQRLSRAFNGEFRGVVMSREAAFSAQDYMAREDTEARLD